MGSHYVTLEARIVVHFRIMNAADEAVALHLAELKFARMYRDMRKRHPTLEEVAPKPEPVSVSPYPPGYTPGEVGRLL